MAESRVGHRSLGALFEARVAATPELEALVAGGFRLTYRELGQLVERAARALTGAGVGHGDRVGVLAAPRPESVILFWACARIGAIFVGFGTRNREQELRYVVGDADLAILFGTTAFEDRRYETMLQRIAADLGLRTIVLEPYRGDGLAPAFERFLDAHPDSGISDTVTAEMPVAIVYTSGSTGAPKGVLLRQHAWLVPFESFLRRWPLVQPRFLGVMPIDHSGSIGNNVIAPVVYGGTLVQLERFSAGAVLRVIESERITAWGGIIPTMLRMLIDHPDFPSADLSSVELMWWTGLVPTATIELLQRRVRWLGTAYGMTESCGAITISDPNPGADVLAHAVGHPVDGVDVRLLVDDAPTSSVGQPGEILVRGPSVMAGYWRKPEATAATMLAGDWLRTGDIGVFRADGNLAIVGRIKEMIRSGGYNIAPAEIEQLLETHPSVASAVVIGLPDEMFGEAINAVVVPRPGQSIHVPDLIDFCRERLSNYKVPKRVHVWDALLLLPSGKVDKPRMRARLQEDLAADESTSQQKGA